MSEPIPLTRAGKPAFAVALASSEQPLVETTAREVATYFEERFSVSPSVVSLEERPGAVQGDEALLVLGTVENRRLRELVEKGGVSWPVDPFSPEAFGLFRVSREQQPPVICAVGADELGVRHGAVEALRRLQTVGGEACIDLPDPIVRSPAFELRFWYVNEGDHVLNRFHSLYWDLAEWEQYIDMVSFFRFNVLEIYPPSVTERGAVFGQEALSGGADRYLERTRAIIRYAHFKGLRVCITMTFNMSGGRPLCPSRDGIEKVAEVNAFFIEALKEADFFNLFPGDPGECRCVECTPDTAIDVQLKVSQIVRERTEATPILSTWSLCGWGDDLYDLTSTYELWGRRQREYPEDVMVQWFPHQESYAGRRLPQKRLAWAYATDPEPPVEVMPHFHLRSLQRYLRQQRDQGIEAVSTNTWSPLLQLVNMFGAAELMWDPDRDVDEIVGDLAAGIFGPGHREVGKAWVELGDMYCKDEKHDKIGNHGVVLFILADGSRSRERGTAEIFRETGDLERGEDAIRLLDSVETPAVPPPFVLSRSPDWYLEEYRYYARFYRDLASHARWVKEARIAARDLGIRLGVVDADMPPEELVRDEVVAILERATAAQVDEELQERIRLALARIEKLDLPSRLEEYYDHTGLDRETHPEPQRQALPTFLIHREFHEDPVVLAPHFRRLSPAHLEQYRREREARRPRLD